MASLEYQQAKDIIDTFTVNQKAYINVSNLPNFRKYLRELGKKASKQFTTRLRTEENDQLKVIRIK